MPSRSNELQIHLHYRYILFCADDFAIKCPSIHILCCRINHPIEMETTTMLDFVKQIIAATVGIMRINTMAINTALITETVTMILISIGITKHHYLHTKEVVIICLSYLDLEETNGSINYIFFKFCCCLFFDFTVGIVMPFAPNGNFSDRPPTSSM